ncbi:calcineurin-like phosphoesterase family protein [Chitinophaga dinghuensis]|uniref:Calcineurin-like phosphoesterase family protein n=1 Tax=Chitinophaga dinghuensis TaxID=1539050 RepID=A0A327W2G9_9BACT|nr:metallophosphoesterase [Chitinophaga dinghuensis]RAJ83471.1 calcineurin-like phosphoesterase family protein [Chitinophaga dinghuensis]
MLKLKAILAVSLMPLAAFAQQYADGPYVYYKGDSAIVKTIFQREDLRSVETKTYPKDKTPALQTGGFSVQLKQDIKIQSSISPKADKVFILSDIEGEFDAGKQLLLAAGVIDPQFNWTFGKGNLVIAGDLFDRGVAVMPWLWLLYSLEDKAAAAGGAVHVVLGNHDVMQLSGDFRYTDASYFKNAWLMGRDMRTVFATDTELGRWLRSKNVMEQIGDLLVMHAGLSPDLLRKGWSLERINETVRPALGTPRKQLPDSMQVFFDSRAPFWYRGYFMDPAASMAVVDSTLQFYNCKKIIVGHTITDTTIVTKYNGKVIGVDVDQHEGHHQGLLIEGEKYYVIDNTGRRKPLE